MTTVYICRTAVSISWTTTTAGFTALILVHVGESVPESSKKSVLTLPTVSLVWLPFDCLLLLEGITSSFFYLLISWIWCQTRWNFFRLAMHGLGGRWGLRRTCAPEKSWIFHLEITFCGFYCAIFTALALHLTCFGAHSKPVDLGSWNLTCSLSTCRLSITTDPVKFSHYGAQPPIFILGQVIFPTF